jgi:hypothetical protein
MEEIYEWDYWFGTTETEDWMKENLKSRNIKQMLHCI